MIRAMADGNRDFGGFPGKRPGAKWRLIEPPSQFAVENGLCRLLRPRHPVYSATRSVGERRPALPPKAQFHPKTLRQKDHRTGLSPFCSEFKTRRQVADSAISTARRSRQSIGSMQSGPTETLESGVDSAHRWGKSLRYRGQRGETQDSFFRFTPFPFPETALIKAYKGLIC